MRTIRKHGIEVYQEFARHVGYEPDTGRLFWLSDRTSCRGLIRRRAGDDAGSVGPDGYVYLALGGRDRRFVKGHRLAWFLARGEVPPQDIDHKDRDRSNNRIGNLRPATRTLNHANRAVRPDNQTGLKGVKRLRGKFQARITHNKVTRHLGTFDTPEEAHAAYLSAAAMTFGEFATDGIA